MYRVVFGLMIALAAWAASDDLRRSPFFIAPEYLGGATHDVDYRDGLGCLEAHRWLDAIACFSRSAGRGGAETDAALYWKAYAQNRAGDPTAALATLHRLEGRFAGSRWLREVRALEVEIQSRTGRPLNPATEHDTTLKLIALDGVMRTNPDEALPELRQVVAGAKTPQAVKNQALFVLATSGRPEAQRVIADLARSVNDEAVRAQAIAYIGLNGGDEARVDLLSLYKATHGEENRKRILRQLAVSGYKDDLWRLYTSASSIPQKQSIIEAMILSGQSDRLLEIARSTETPQTLRVDAVHTLGLLSDEHISGDLTKLFHTDRNPEVKRAVLDTFFMQSNGAALVALARTERDPKMQEEIVRHMSLLSSKEVNDYRRELLK